MQQFPTGVSHGLNRYSFPRNEYENENSQFNFGKRDSG